MTLTEQKQLPKSLSGGVPGAAWGFSSNTYVILQRRREEGVRQRDLEEIDESRESRLSTRLLFAFIPSCLSLSIPLPPPSLPLWLADSLAGHLHGVGDRADSLGAVGVGAGPRAGPIHGAGAGQGGCPGASQSGHTG